jgi:hypothetical protein
VFSLPAEVPARGRCCSQQGTGFRWLYERGAATFLLRSSEEILIQAVCAKNSSWSALRSSSLASQVNEKNKRRLPQLRVTVFHKGQVGMRWGLVFIFASSGFTAKSFTTRSRSTKERRLIARGQRTQEFAFRSQGAPGGCLSGANSPRLLH